MGPAQKPDQARVALLGLADDAHHLGEPGGVKTGLFEIGGAFPVSFAFNWFGIVQNCILCIQIEEELTADLGILADDTLGGHGPAVFGRESLHAVARCDVGDFMGEDGGQLVAVGEGFEQAAIDEDLSARQRKVVQVRFVDQMDGIGEAAPVGVGADFSRQAVEILVHLLIADDLEDLPGLNRDLFSEGDLLFDADEGEFAGIAAAGAGEKGQGCSGEEDRGDHGFFHFLIISMNSASVRTGMPSARALFSLLPAASPAMT